jgi:hypothetical protein
VKAVAQEATGGSDCPTGDDHPGQAPDCMVRVGVRAVFHLHVLKPALIQRDASGNAPGISTKKQMSLDLEDLW